MMSDVVHMVAVTIVDTILDDLRGRKGIGNELDEIDASIYNEMRDTLVLKVVGQLVATDE